MAVIGIFLHRFRLPYSEACSGHITKGSKSSQAYSFISKSLSNNRDHLQRLVEAVDERDIVGVRLGMKPQST